MDYDQFKASYIKENFSAPVTTDPNSINSLCESLSIANQYAIAFRCDTKNIGQLYECLISLQELNESAEAFKNKYKKELQEHEARISK